MKPILFTKQAKALYEKIQEIEKKEKELHDKHVKSKKTILLKK